MKEANARLAFVRKEKGGSPKDYLVGGFSPFELVKLDDFPGRDDQWDEHKKYLKPSPILYIGSGSQMSMYSFQLFGRVWKSNGILAGYFLYIYITGFTLPVYHPFHTNYKLKTTSWDVA